MTCLKCLLKTNLLENDKRDSQRQQNEMLVEYFLL